jgi:predicted ribosome-associated RNA-binding protein Tma20
MMAKHPESKLLNESQIQQELALALVQTFELATYHKGNVLLFNSDSYLIPTKIILILKRLKKIDMKEGIVIVDYTHLVWINLKGLSKEIS